MIDPKLGLAYFPTGNPWPDIGGRGPGDEDYMDGVVALDMKTGKLKWFYQTTHHDEWDYDCAQPPVLWEHEIEGQQVKGLSIGCKNGYVYELNRETGEPVTPVKEEELSNAKSDPKAKAEDEKLGWVQQNGEPLTEPIPVDAGEVVPHCAVEEPAAAGGARRQGLRIRLRLHVLRQRPLHGGLERHLARLGAVELRPDHRLHVLLRQRRHPRGETEGLQRRTDQRDGSVPAALRERRRRRRDRAPAGLVHRAEPGRQQSRLAGQRQDWDRMRGWLGDQRGGVVFVPDSLGKLHGYDVSTGKEVWSYEHESLSIDAPPIVYENEGKEFVAIAATLEGQAALLGFALGAEEPAPLTTPVTGGGRSVAERTYSPPTAATCHTLAAAEATGQVGPNLDELKPSEKTVQTQVETGGDKMPSFKGKLSPAEIKSVATFVSKSAGKE